MATRSEMQNEMFPVFVPKSSVYTVKSKYPCTTYNTNFLDWSHDPLHPGVNLMRFHPLQGFHPNAPKYLFRPLPPHERPVKDQRMDVRKMLAARGRKGLLTPELSIHIGLKHFSLDPTIKKLRHFDDPIPAPLVTTKRADFVDPRSMPLFCEQNCERFGLSSNDCAFGIVPCTLAIPPEPVTHASII